MKLLLALLVVALASVIVAQSPVAWVTTYATFSGLTPTQGATYQWLYYVTNSTFQPTSEAWNCNNVPGICTRNCGTSSANGPQCLTNPTLNDSPITGTVQSGSSWYLATWPWQVRWGQPASGHSVDSGIPSGFGYRGTFNQSISSIYQTFWVGEGVHFNNVIYSGTQSDSWTLSLTLYIKPNNASSPAVNHTFSYPLNLFETINKCSSQGCPWSSTWWSQHPSADTNPNCQYANLITQPDLDSASGAYEGENCCPFYTISNDPCADKVWTLGALVQNTSIMINGKLYTLYIKGFSDPNNSSLQKTYFISQENTHTTAEIYGNLIDACPNTCPNGESYTISADGTACVCNCSSGSTPTCSPPQVMNSTCACNCPANALNCGAGTVATVGSTCQCDCSGISCPGQQQLNSTDCSCYCPASVCANGGTPVLTPSGCACQCSPSGCTAPQVADATCNCACPTAAATACANAAGTFDTTLCTCSIPCTCFNTSCTTQTCDSLSGQCTTTNINEGGACDPTNSLCVAKCVAGTCVYNAVTCSPTTNHPDPADASCFSSACTPGTGLCVDTPATGQACTPDSGVLGSYSADCVTGACTATGCTVTPLADGVPCTSASLPAGWDPQCNAPQCQTGVCTYVAQVNQTCSDGLACTYWSGATDVSGTLTDSCQKIGANVNATCSSNARRCSQQVTCNAVSCEETAAGPFCIQTPLGYGTACNDGFDCTTNDTCGRLLETDPVTGVIGWVNSGVCSGLAVVCNTGNPCIVGRCLEGTGCVNRTDVRNNFVCNVTNKNCTVYRCNNGECNQTQHVCPGHSSNTGAIVGASVAGVGALCAAAAIALWARHRAAKSEVFDPTTWAQLNAGAGANSPIYTPNNREYSNSIYAGQDGSTA